MALSKPNNAFYKLTAEDRQKIPMPDRFKCRQCDQFKIPASFSNKEIKDYQFKKFCVPTTNGINARLRCRPCAGEQLHELQCEGQCGMRKPLDEFSKAQRTRGLKWCQECILWKEAAEPGILTAAAPGTELAPDEDPDGSGWGYSSDPELGSESDDEKTEYAFTPWQTSMGSRQESGKLDAASSTQLSASMSSNITQPTPYSQEMPVGLPDRVPTGALPSGAYAPPHIRAMNREAPVMQSSQPDVENLIDVEDTKTESSISNPYEDMWSLSGTVGPWSAVDTRRRNALYEPQRPVEEHVLPARVPAPDPAAAAAQPAPRSRGWVKAVGVRVPPPQFPQPTKNPSRQRRGYDSDDSPDEM